MLKIGVTGGIGSGKTLLCSIIEKLGYPVYHADREAKKLTDSHPEIVIKVSALFGEDIYINGQLDRKRVSGLVFDNSTLLFKLNSIIHPIVGEGFKEWAERKSDQLLVFQEAAILFESGANEWVDKVVAVWAPEELRIKRVTVRDGLTEYEVKKRMNHQISEAELLKRSDIVIRNDEQELLTPQVLASINQLLEFSIEN